MATEGIGNIIRDKSTDDKSDKKHIQVSSSSSHCSSPSTSQQTSSGSLKQITIAANDSGYKDAHPIGSRRVTENIITYHEPIFQTVVNTLYENKRSLNMGKRKVIDIEKEEAISPDNKKKRLDSPKMDTGFKVKKKCSIENIIERIRNEKTQSRGNTSPTSESAGQSVKDTRAQGCPSLLSSCRHPTEPIKTGLVNKNTEVDKSVKMKSGLGENSKSVTTKASICEVNGKKSGINTESDTVLDLSMKPSYQKSLLHSKLNMTESSPFRHSLPFPSRLKHSENFAGKFSKGVKGMSVLHSSCKDKSEGVVIETAKTTCASAMKTKTKPTGVTLNKVADKLKHNKVLESVAKAIGKKSAEKGAIKTRKRTNSKVTFSEKDKNKQDTSDSDSESKSGKNTKKSVKSKTTKKTEKNPKSQLAKLKNQKVPIAFRRVKREASLNAATLVNIIYEKNKSPKLDAKRSKSESDLAPSPKKTLFSSKSFTDVAVKGMSYMVHQMTDSEVVKSPKKEPSTPAKDHSSSKKQLKLNAQSISEDKLTDECSKSLKKEPESPMKRKASISNDDFDDIVKTVLKQKSVGTKANREKNNDNVNSTSPKKKNLIKGNEQQKTKSVETIYVEKKDNTKSCNKESGEPLHNINQVVSKSPEEVAERKRKANLARLNKAKELQITKRLFNAKECFDESEDSENDTGSESAETDKTVNDETMNLKVRTKKGELCRAARTHVHVESKTVFENTNVAAQWCECCQSTYYPSQPQQGTKVWRIKQLVDKGTQNPPELIQSASHHFIAAHAGCEVRPYSSPTHVSVLDSGPYVAPLMSHGHVTCTPACGYRHTGMLHTAQCQNYALLPCQRYSNTYSVSYQHGHGSYPHSGCGSCCTGGSFHSPGQALLHQPNIPITTETPILLHHTVPLHDTSHSVPLQRAPPHTDSGIPSCQVPLQINDSNRQEVGHCCQLSQGEIIIRTNSQSDHELIDVGKDDVGKQAPKCSIKASTTKQTPSLVKDGSKPVTKVRKSSSSVEIKGSSHVNPKKQELNPETLGKQGKIGKQGTTGKQVAGMKPVKGQEQVNEKLSLEKNKQRKKSDSSKKKQKVSENKGSKSDKKNLTKSGNSSKGAIKGGRSDLQEDTEEERKVFSPHGWTWEGEGVIKKVINIFDGQPVERKCFPSIRHEDGEIICVKDCVLVCSGRKDKDIPYVAKVTNFWEDPSTKEMMMTLLWYYRPEHVEGGRRPENQPNEVFAAKHRDESLVACIDDRGFVLTYNEFCRFMGEVLRIKYNLPSRKKVVPNPEEMYPSNRIPPVDVDPENVFLCRHVYDLKLKRVLKNPS